MNPYGQLRWLFDDVGPSWRYRATRSTFVVTKGSPSQTAAGAKCRLGYTRVSTSEQDLATQRNQLAAFGVPEGQIAPITD